jgi:hypothetical protein
MASDDEGTGQRVGETFSLRIDSSLLGDPYCRPCIAGLRFAPDTWRQSSHANILLRRIAMKSWKSRMLLLALVLALPLAVNAQVRSAPLLATWSLNVDKSTYNPAPAPKSATGSSWTFAQTPDGIELSVTANGETHTSSLFKLDGKPYPMRGGSAIDAHALTQFSRLETKSDLMRGGQVVGHATILVSRNLKTMTVENTYTTSSGQSAHNVMVFDRH